MKGNYIYLRAGDFLKIIYRASGYTYYSRVGLFDIDSDGICYLTGHSELRIISSKFKHIHNKFQALSEFKPKKLVQAFAISEGKVYY